jgi:hypothetical protein
MKKKKYLPLYYKWMEKEFIDGGGGLCFAFDFVPEDLILFKPEDQSGYWAYWGEFGDTEILSQNVNDPKLRYDLLKRFNPLRQTIVLFMAAMNDEL